MGSAAYPAGRRLGFSLAGLAIVTLGILLSVFFGFVAGTGNLFFVLVLSLLMLGVVLALRPVVLLWTILVGGLVLVGLAKLYLPPLQYLRWVVVVGAALLPFLVLLSRALHPDARRPEPMPALFWWVVGFMLYAGVVTALNWGGRGAAIAGMKDYFQAWGVILALAFLPEHPGRSRLLLALLLGIGFLQLPFVLHQYFYLVPLRAGIQGLSAQDIVAGTFGAQLGGGGNNAALSAYLFFCVALLLGLWKAGRLVGGRLVLGLVWLAIPVFLNESKISLFYMLVVYLAVFPEDLVQRTGRLILASLAVAGLLALFIFVYYSHSQEAGHAYSLANYFDQIVAGQVERGYGTLDLNRWTALTFWFQEHIADPWHMLIGHGLGQTREGALLLEVGNTLAATRYPGKGIGLTALTSLLWETGVIGVGLLLGLLWAAFRQAGRLAAALRGSPLDYALFVGMRACIAIVALGLIHKGFFVFELAYQMMVVIVLGFLVHSARQQVKIQPAGPSSPTGTGLATP
jgi:hypothetical protein